MTALMAIAAAEKTAMRPVPVTAPEAAIVALAVSVAVVRVASAMSQAVVIESAALMNVAKKLLRICSPACFQFARPVTPCASVLDTV